ncbi:MAG: DegV family protein [bacterium]
MKDYIIFTDSTTDLPDSFVKENNIEVLPLTFTLEGKDYKNYLDERELSTKDFYDAMRKGKQPVTAQINSEEFLEAITPFVEKGLDILYICFSSALSGTFNSVRLGLEVLKETHPDANVKVIDSKLASAGEGLLVYYANKFKKEGLSLEENFEKTEKFKEKVCAWFTVSDIDTLKRGGRLSNAAAFIANALKIKPILHISEEGKLVAKGKKRGRDTSLTTLIAEMEQRIIVEENDVIIIAHGDCLEEAEQLKNDIESKFGISNFILTNIGPVIGAHTGPDAMTLFFVGKEK